MCVTKILHWCAVICVCNEDFALVCNGYQVCAMKDNNSDNAMRHDEERYENMCVIKDSNRNGETVGRDAKDPKTRIKGRLCDIIYVRANLSPRI